MTGWSRCWWLTVTKTDILSKKVTMLGLFSVLKSYFYIHTQYMYLHMLMLLSDCCICFVLVEVLSLKCHLLYILPEVSVSYSSPDASFHSSWNDRLLFHFTVHFKLLVKAFGALAAMFFLLFWFPDKVHRVILQHSRFCVLHIVWPNTNRFNLYLFLHSVQEEITIL